MGIFDILKKDNRLKEDFSLSEYFDPYFHSGDVYIASQHCVHKRVVIPGGPQGYTVIKIPERIKTKERLYEFLIQEHKFVRKTNVQIPKTAPIVKPPVVLKTKTYNLFNIIEGDTTSISVDILVESGCLVAHKIDISYLGGFYGIRRTPVSISYSTFSEFLQQAPVEIQEKYRGFSEINWKDYIPSEYNEPHFCECSPNKQHTFVSFGTHKKSCVGTPTNYTVHRCSKCGYIHQGFIVPPNLGQIVERVVTEI